MANVVSIIIKATDQYSNMLAKATKDWQSFGKALGSVGLTMAKSIGVAGVAAAGAATAAMVELTREGILFADAAGKMAAQCGMAVEEFTALDFAARQADVSQDALKAGMKSLSAEMVKAGRGGESLLAEILSISDQFAGMADGAAKVALAQEHFGKSGQALIPLLNQGSEAIRQQLEQAKALGLVVGSEFAARADEFNDKCALMRESLRGLGLMVADNILPSLLKVITGFNEWVQNSGAIQTAVEAITIAFAGLADAMDVATNNSRSWWEVLFSGIQGARDTFADVFKNAFAPLQSGLTKGLTPPKDTAPEVKTEDLEKALDLEQKINLERATGAWLLTQKEAEAYAKRLEIIDAFAIDEAGKRELREMAEIAHNERLQEMWKTGEMQRADLDARFREGDVQRFVQSLQAMQGAQLAWLEACRNLMRTFQDLWSTSLFNMRASFLNFISSTLPQFSQGIGSAMADIIVYGKEAGQVFSELGKRMLASLVSFGTQLVVNAALAMALQAAIGASAVAAISPILTAWAAAATAASIATMGSAVAAGSAVIPAMAMNAGMSKAFLGMAHSGLDFVPNEGTYLLQRGERVLQPAANVELMRFLRAQREADTRPVQITFEVGGTKLGEVLYSLSRSGQLKIHSKSIV